MSHPTSSAAVELAGMRGRVVELAETLWAARDSEELMEVIAEIEALKCTLDATTLDVVHELDATGGVKAAGWASTQDFLTHTAGGHKGTGPAAVRLGHATQDPGLAPLAEAMRDGWLSTPKAHVIERAIDGLPGDPDLRARGVQVMLDHAKSLDASELKRAALHLVNVVDPDGEERRDEQALDRLERAAHHSRHLTITDDQAGGAWIRGRCSSEDAALIKATLIPLAAPEPAADGERDPRDHGARMLDALVRACRLLQGTDLLPESHGAVPRLAITIDYEKLRDQSGIGLTESGEHLSASAIRRLCCEADVIPVVLGGNEQVLDVGRQQRLVSAAIWKALVVRDQHCRFPRCTRPPLMCHAHHIAHWVDGGHTSLTNLILLCGHHHRLIHNSPWHIETLSSGDFEFHPPPRTARPSSDRSPPDG